jgi:hypothetical protein
MTGTRRKKRLFQWRYMYFLGSSTPTANTPTAMTMRVNSRVILSMLSSVLFPQERGSKMFAPWGPEREIAKSL